MKTAPKKKLKNSTKKTTKKAVKLVAKKRVVRKQTIRQVSIASPVAPDIRLIVASELADDSLIESELMGEVLPYFIYQFKQDGKMIAGLTVKGVSEVVRRLNRNLKSGYKIRINPEHIRIERDVEYNNEKGVEVSVFAENLVDGNSAWGIKFEPYYKKGRRGKYNNSFAVEKALSKAERNAKRKLIPETAATKMIQTMLGDSSGKNVKQIEAPAYTERVITPPIPKTSTPEDLCELIIKNIEATRDIGVVIDIDEKTQSSEKLNDELKKKIHEIAISRVDILQV